MKYEDWPWKMTEKKMGSHEEMGISSTRIWGFSSSNRIHLPIVAVFQQWKIWENGNHHSWEYREWDDVVKTPSHWVPNILDIFCRVSWLRWCCYGVVKRLVLLCGWNSRTENNVPNGFFLNTCFVPLELITCADSRSWWKRCVTGYPLN